MADIANVAIRFDTSTVKDGKAELSSVLPVAKQVDAALDDLAKSSKDTAKGISDVGKAASDAASGIDKANGSLNKAAKGAADTGKAASDAGGALDKAGSAIDNAAKGADDLANSVKKATNENKNLAASSGVVSDNLSKIAADTNDAAKNLNKQGDALDKVSKSGKDLGKTLDDVSGSTAKIESGVNSVESSAGALSSSLDKESSSLNKVAAATEEVNSATTKIVATNKAAATSVDQVSTKMQTSATSNQAAIGKTTTALQAEADTLQSVAANTNHYSEAVAKATNDNKALATSTNALKGQVGNIAAQFNDIGVQLAGGQSPFLIALQQGTQLTQIFGGQGLTSIMSGLGSALFSLVSPVSVLTIGFITLGGTALQYFTELIGSSSKSAEELAKQQDMIRGVADAWGAATPALREYIDELDRAKSMKELQDATKIAVADQFVDVKNKLEDANLSFSAFIIDLQQAGAESTSILTLQESFASLTEKISKGTAETSDLDKVQAALAATFSETGIPATMQMTSLFDALSLSLSNAASKAAALTEQATAAAQAAMNIKFSGIEDSLPVGRVPTPESRPKIELEGLPGQYDSAGNLTGIYKPAKVPKAKKAAGPKGKTEAERYDDLIKASDRRIESLKAEQAAVGMNEQAAASLKYETQMLNDAQQKNITLTDTQKVQIKAAADQMSILETETKKQREALDFQKDVTRGFIDDMISGLKQGESLWQSFGEAALNVLDKIADKLLDSALDSLFNPGAAGAGGGAGGFLGGLFSLFGLKSAKGNAFDGGRVARFANGGTFTNNIVKKPTLFKYAQGGAIGEMGEAGPEAIMPLSRGPNGSLGVTMHRSNIAANANSGGKQVLDINLTDDSGRMSDIADQQIKLRSGDIVKVSVKTVHQSLPAMQRANRLHSKG